MTLSTMASEFSPHSLPEAGASRRRRRRLFGWVAAAAIVLRLLYFAEHGGSAFFERPMLDEKFHDTVARALVADHELASINPSFRTLLYPAYLALCYRAATPEGGVIDQGWGYSLAVLGQHLMGVLNALLVAALALRLYGRVAAGAVAAALFLLAGPPLYFEGELLAETLFGLLLLALLWLLARCRVDGHWQLWLAAGALLALAAQARPNALALLLAFPLAAWWQAGAADRGMRLRRAGAALAGCAVGLGLLGALQAPWVGELSWLPSAGGVNLYLGNKRSADGMIPRQDEHASAGDVYRDSVQIFAEEVFRREHGRDPRSAGEVSSYWLGRTLDEVAADPAAWVGLMGRKLLLLVWDAEIPNNKSYAFALLEESRLLPWLPVRFGGLLALAAAGAVLGWRRADRHLLLWLLASAILFALGVALFFVNARYRLPLWPLLAVLAGGLASSRLELAARGRLAALAAALGLALALPNWTGARLPSLGRDYFFRSIAWLDRGDLDRAAADADRAAALDPGELAAVFQQGTVALARGDDGRAHELFSRVAFQLPTEPRAFNNMGVAAERLGRVHEAYLAYERAVEVSATFSPAWINAALIDLRAGQLDEAERRLAHVARLDGDSIPALCARAFLARDRGRVAAARRLLERAAARDPELVAQLVADNARRLQPLFQRGEETKAEGGGGG
jgi:Tfp pilus assembly protein PilF